MKIFGFIAALAFASTALAHPNGLYEIDAKADVTVSFLVVGKCPLDQAEALAGSLRTLTFSEAAAAEPYSFESGYYVEIHDAEREVYVQTDELCVPLAEGREIPASRSTFAGLPLRRL